MKLLIKPHGFTLVPDTELEHAAINKWRRDGIRCISREDEQFTLVFSTARHSDVLHQIEYLLNGIDRTETDTPFGWWETSTGAESGAAILKKIRALFQDQKGGT